MRVLLSLLAFAVGVKSLAPIVGLESATAVNGSYIVVLKKDLTKRDFVSHVEWADGVLGVAGVEKVKTFDVGGLKGYSVKAGSDAIGALAERDEVGHFLFPSGLLWYVC